MGLSLGFKSNMGPPPRGPSVLAPTTTGSAMASFTRSNLRLYCRHCGAVAAIASCERVTEKSTETIYDVTLSCGHMRDMVRIATRTLERTKQIEKELEDEYSETDTPIETDSDDPSELSFCVRGQRRDEQVQDQED